MDDKIYLKKKKMDAENAKMQNEAQSVFSISGYLIWLLPARSHAQVVRYRRAGCEPLQVSQRH